MCKGGGKQSSVEENVDNTNIGLVNLSETGLTSFGIGEVLTVLLLMLVIAIIGAYCCKERKRARMLEMEQSVRAGSTGQLRCKKNCTHTDKNFKHCQQIC